MIVVPHFDTTPVTIPTYRYNELIKFEEELMLYGQVVWTIGSGYYDSLKQVGLISDEEDLEE